MSHRQQIMVIDPAVEEAELDCFNQLVMMSSLPLTYHLPALFGIGSLKNVQGDPAGIVVLGSASSVHDKRVWQRMLMEWLDPMMGKGVPTLGICFGHQMIAHHFGGKVQFVFQNKKKVRGFRNVHLNANPLWGAKPLEIPLFVSHNEVVVSCPEPMRIVGTSSEMAIEALAHKKLPIWTFQPHPEATPSFACEEGDLSDEEEKKFRFGHDLMRSFLDFVARQG